MSVLGLHKVMVMINTGPPVTVIAHRSRGETAERLWLLAWVGLGTELGSFCHFLLSYSNYPKSRHVAVAFYTDQ